MYMSMANIKTLRCFENTRDYAKLNYLMYRRMTTCMYVESCALERLQWIWRNFPASSVVWVETIVITYRYLMSLSVNLLNLYCTCVYVFIHACSWNCYHVHSLGLQLMQDLSIRNFTSISLSVGTKAIHSSSC